MVARPGEELPYASLPTMSPGRALPLLDGVCVLDLTTSIAGPYAGMLLADLGADVIKVERPEGDDARQWGPPFLDGQALWFSAVNRGKRSVVINLHRDADRQRLFKLVASADVVIVNQPVAVQSKLHIDYETLRAAKADIVFASITGFGLDGERADLGCYDLIAEGYSGVMDLTGEPGAPPQKVGAPAGDMLAGQDAAMAVIAALFARQRTGKGARIDVSLVESMTRFLSCRIVPYLGGGEVPRRSGGRDSVIAIYQVFETADRPITLGLGTDAIWRRFWEAVGDAEYGRQTRYATNERRRGHRDEIVARIQTILAERTRAEWLGILAAARVPAGPVNRVDELVEDVPLQERGMIFTLTGDDGRRVPQVGLGIRVDGRVSVPSRLPPCLGEHDQEVFEGHRGAAVVAAHNDGLA